MALLNAIFVYVQYFGGMNLVDAIFVYVQCFGGRKLVDAIIVYVQCCHVDNTVEGEHRVSKLLECSVCSTRMFHL